MHRRILSAAMAGPACLACQGSAQCKKKDENPFLSVLLISCAEYDVFSPVALHYLKKNVIPYVKDLKTYYTSSRCEKTSHVLQGMGGSSNISTGDLSSKDFCARLLSALQVIPSDYIFLVQEDHWYTTPTFDQQGWDTLLKVCDDYDLDQLKLHTLSSIPDLPQLARNNDVLYQSRLSRNTDDCDSLSGIQSGSRVRGGGEPAMTVTWAGGCDYPISHHATLFRRTYLIDQLRETVDTGRKSPWQHECYAFKDRENVKRRNEDGRTLRIACVVPHSDAPEETEEDPFKWHDGGGSGVGVLASVVRYGRLGKHGQKIVADQAQAGHPLFVRVERELEGSTFLREDDSLMKEIDSLLLYQYGSTSSVLAKNVYEKLQRAVASSAK